MRAQAFNIAVAGAGGRPCHRAAAASRRMLPALARRLAAAAIAMVLANQAVADEAKAPVAVAPGGLAALLWPEGSARLTDPSGHVLGPLDLADKVVAVTFFETRCSAPCALKTRDLATVAQALDAEERSHLAILAISLDPVRDDPAALAEFAAGMRLDTSAVTLLASGAESTRDRLRLIRFQAQPGSAEPIPSTIFVFDRVGQMAMRYAGDPVDRRRLTTDLATLARLGHGVGRPD